MTSTRARLGVVSGLFVGGWFVVAVHLWLLMVAQHDTWAARSHENRWAFRSVPSMRGALRDRTGRTLAWDEPGTELSLYYLRFRLRHPVGSAVHAATTWAGLQPGGEGTTYCYLDGPRGPRAAARDLLAMPVECVRPGRFEKHVAAQLAYEATTVLSACSGQTRKKVFAALREAAARDGRTAVGDALPDVRAEALLAAYDGIVESLHALERELAAEQAARRSAATSASPTASVAAEPAAPLFDVLERMRRASLAGERAVRRGPHGEPRQGDLLETMARPFADQVSFELAATLRVGAARHPGLEVRPGVHRVRCEPVGTSLRALLGGVSDLDRVQPDEGWLQRYLDRELPADWLDELVPANAAGDAERARFQQEALESYRREMLLAERRGTTGAEAAFDGELMGRLGMRLVEHDAGRREHLLWSQLRVEAGEDVTLTFDLALQRAAEEVVRQQQQAMAALYQGDGAERDRERVEAALAVVDARSGDVLAYAGAPVAGTSPIQVPGMYWHGNGALGSVVKPFVLIEQVQAESMGRPHRPLAELRACEGVWRGGTVRVSCSHRPGGQAGDPVRALADSCNAFFCQCGQGLGEEGLARALRRFGLLEPGGDAEFAACWQPSVRGLSPAPPVVHVRHEVLPKRAIGYGVEASPLHVARAYAALATGWLPTLGVLHGERRPAVSFADLEPELELVREGLRACVERGTARHLTVLQDHQVLGKTGTAEVSSRGQNNAWFAGFLPWAGRDGVQLCFCAVVYLVPDGQHGGDAAGRIVADLLLRLHGDAELQARYLLPEGGR